MYGAFLRIWGDFACFTRPEMKVERVSYDVITPSAARAVFDAIHWHPTFRWVIDRIYVCRPIKFMTIRRNELEGGVITLKQVSRGELRPVLVESSRQQRASTILRDVNYVVKAHIEMRTGDELRRLGYDPSQFDASEETPQKHISIFRRRAQKGQCFAQPYLGCREFSAFFALMDHNPKVFPGQYSSGLPEEKVLSTSEIYTIPETRDLSWMLFDIDYFAEGGPAPMLFRAQMNEGIVDVPHPSSEEVKR